MLNEVMEGFAQNKPMYRIKMATQRMGITYFVFHEIPDFNGRFVTLKKGQAMETIEMIVPSTVQGGKPRSETRTRSVLTTTMIPADSIQEVELITHEDAEYAEIKTGVETYLAKVKLNMEKEKADA